MKELKSKFFDFTGARIDITKITPEQLVEDACYFFLSQEDISLVNLIFEPDEPFTKTGHYFYDYDCEEFLRLEDIQKSVKKIRKVFARS